jgi:hypothetical protein
MKKVIDAVRDEIEQDLEATNTMARGLLNLSEYARTIKERVEQASKKEVTHQSIVVSLSRIEKNIKAKDYLRKVEIRQLSLHNPVTQLIYTKESLSETDILTINTLREGKEFFSFTIGTKDISIILLSRDALLLLSQISHTPRVQKDELAAITIQFPEYLVEESGVGLTLLHKIALNNIPLDSAYTTYNEFTLIFEARFLSRLLSVLQ